MSFKFTLSVILGAAIGGVIAHYLQTEEGRAFVNRIKDDTSDLTRSLAGGKSQQERESFSSPQYDQQPEAVETIVVVGLDA